MSRYPALKTGYVGRIVPQGEHHAGQRMAQPYVRVARMAADAPTAYRRTNPEAYRISRQTVQAGTRLKLALAPGGGAISLTPVPWGSNRSAWFLNDVCPPIADTEWLPNDVCLPFAGAEWMSAAGGQPCGRLALHSTRAGTNLINRR